MRFLLLFFREEKEAKSHSRALRRPWKSRGRKPFGAGDVLFHYRTSYHRKNGLRCGVIYYIRQRLFAKVMFSADAIVQACTFIVETLISFHLTQPLLVGGLVFIFINLYITWILKLKFCTKRFMGPGETRHKQPQTRCKLWFNEKHQRNKK